MRTFFFFIFSVVALSLPLSAEATATSSIGNPICPLGADVNCFERADSAFGPRIQNGTFDFHQGVDFDGEIGEPIYAIWPNGYVYNISYSESGGNRVYIVHTANDGSLYFVKYRHLDSSTVNEGDYVNQGDQIGTLGDTGNVNSPHLHMDVYLAGSDTRGDKSLGYRINNGECVEIMSSPEEYCTEYRVNFLSLLSLPSYLSDEDSKISLSPSEPVQQPDASFSLTTKVHIDAYKLGWEWIKAKDAEGNEYYYDITEIDNDAYGIAPLDIDNPTVNLKMGGTVRVTPEPLTQSDANHIYTVQFAKIPTAITSLSVGDSWGDVASITFLKEDTPTEDVSTIAIDKAILHIDLAEKAILTAESEAKDITTAQTYLNRAYKFLKQAIQHHLSGNNKKSDLYAKQSIKYADLAIEALNPKDDKKGENKGNGRVGGLLYLKLILKF